MEQKNEINKNQSHFSAVEVLSKSDVAIIVDEKPIVDASDEALKLQQLKLAQRHRDEIEKNYWRTIGKRMLKDWRLYAMLLPILLVFLFWRYFPLYGLLAAFKKDDPTVGITEQLFLGFYSFKQLIFGADAVMFWQAFRNTFVISFYGLVFGFPAPIILALMFSEIRSNTYRSIVQIFCYLPKFVSTVVVTTIIALLLNGAVSGSEPGVLAQLMEKLGLATTEEVNRSILRSPQYFRAIFQISGIWETAGYGSIVFFAAIIGISPTSYEAARMDGATKMAQIRYVVIPGILSTITIMLILQIGQLLSVGYEKVLLLYNSDTYSTADVVATYVMRKSGMQGGGTNSNQSLATAADLINAVLSMVLVIGANLISKKASDTSLF